jgi:hypothetical protein
MFGDALSLATERKVSQSNATSKSKVKQEIEEDESVPQYEIVYKEGDDIPRDVLVAFLKKVAEEMSMDSNVKKLVAKNKARGIPLHTLGMEFQRDMLERDFKIDRDHGSRYLGMIPYKFPNDDEITELGKNFIFKAMKFFLDSLKKRSTSFKKLRKSGGMKPETIHEFLEGCLALMAMPESKDALKQAYEETKSAPGPKVIELQRSILVYLGIDADYGCSCLNKIGEDYPNDRTLHIKMQHFAFSAQLACEESMMSEEKKKEFYEGIPPFMHYSPHIFIMQQRQMAAKQQMQQQQQMQRDNPGFHSEVAGVQELMASADGRKMVSAVSAKLKSASARVSKELAEWTVDKKKEFIEEFGSSPLLEEISTAGSNMAKRLEKFSTLSEPELEQVVRLQTLVNEDMENGGSLGLNASEEKMKMLKRAANVGQNSLSSMMNRLHVDRQPEHVHGPGCNHGHSAPQAPDVASGLTDQMER